MNLIDVLKETQYMLGQIAKKHANIDLLNTLSNQHNTSVLFVDATGDEWAVGGISPYCIKKMIDTAITQTTREIAQCNHDIKAMAEQLLDKALVENYYTDLSAEISRLQSLNASLLESIRQSQNP